MYIQVLWSTTHGLHDSQASTISDWTDGYGGCNHKVYHMYIYKEGKVRYTLDCISMMDQYKWMMYNKFERGTPQQTNFWSNQSNEFLCRKLILGDEVYYLGRADMKEDKICTENSCSRLFASSLKVGVEVSERGE